MTKEKKDAAKDESAAPKKSGGMMGIIIVATVALVVALGGTVGVLMVMGGDPADTGDTSTTDSLAHSDTTLLSDSTSLEHADESHARAHPNQSGANDHAAAVELPEGLEADDVKAIDNIVANLQVLEGTPVSDGEVTSHDSKVLSDSLERWLESEKAALKEKETQIETRQKAVEAKESEINRKLGLVEQAQSNRIASLAKLYDSMEPREAAQVLLGMDNETIVLVLPRMKTQNAAAVLALFPPQRASLLSKKMISFAEESP